MGRPKFTGEIRAFSPKPLTHEERAAALRGRGELGAAATLYLDLIAAHRVHGEKTGSTEAQKVASISAQYESIPIIDPRVALSVLRLVSLGVKEMEADLPKPPPFVVLFALALANKSLGLASPTGGSTITAEEFVATWGLQEWLKQNPDVRISHEEFGNLIASERQRARARKPRRKRLMSRYLASPSSFSVSALDADGRVTITDRVTGENVRVQWESVERAIRRKQPGR